MSSPEPLPHRVCLSVTGCLAGLPLRDALDAAYDAGYRSIAVMPAGSPRHSLGKPLPTLAWDALSLPERDEIRTRLDRFDRISLHQSWDDRARFWIDVAAEIGAEIVTVHARIPKDGASPEIIARRAEELRDLAEYAMNAGILIGIENEGGRTADFLALIESVDHPGVGVTLDIGHVAYFAEAPGPEHSRAARAAAYNTFLHEVVRELAPRLFLLHVHNVRPYEEVDFRRIPAPYWRPGMLVDHRLPDQGLIDFPALFRLLDAVGYTGMFEIEIEEPDVLPPAAHAGRFLADLLEQPSDRGRREPV